MSVYQDINGCTVAHILVVFDNMKVFGIYSFENGIYVVAFLQGNQLNMAVYFWYLLKSDLQGTRNTRPS